LPSHRYPTEKGPLEAGRSVLVVMMLRHLLELVLRPGRDRMDMAILVAHELEIAQGDGDRLGANSQEAADIDNGSGGRASAVHMVDLADLVVVGTVDGCILENIRGEFGSAEAHVIAMIHLAGSFFVSPAQ